MGKLAWAVLALSLCAACGDDGASDRDRASSDAAQADMDADAGIPPLIEVARKEVALYDRRIRASCPCLVAQGVYETEEECLRLGLSGPDWAECATMALADYDNAMTRAQSQCYMDFMREAAECTEAAKCDTDQLAVCGVPDPDCLAANSERINLILTACPDFGLLSRVTP